MYETKCHMDLSTILNKMPHKSGGQHLESVKATSKNP